MLTTSYSWRALSPLEGLVGFLEPEPPMSATDSSSCSSSSSNPSEYSSSESFYELSNIILSRLYEPLPFPVSFLSSFSVLLKSSVMVRCWSECVSGIGDSKLCSNRFLSAGNNERMKSVFSESVRVRKVSSNLSPCELYYYLGAVCWNC